MKLELDLEGIRISVLKFWDGLIMRENILFYDDLVEGNFKLSAVINNGLSTTKIDVMDYDIRGNVVTLKISDDNFIVTDIKNVVLSIDRVSQPSPMESSGIFRM